MFFPRLRRQVKWMFVFLALVFAAGFVVFNVGSGGGGTGIGDLLVNKNGSASGQPSVKDAQKKLAKNPNDAAAYLELATAQETKGDNDAAIRALERYTQLRPRDEQGLTRLATSYAAKATRLQNDVAQVQREAEADLPGSLVAPRVQLKSGQPLVHAPIDEAVSTKLQDRFTKASTAEQTALSQTISAYGKAAALNPADPSLQLQLASAAQAAGDAKTAIKAYRRALKLAPDDSNAPFIKQQIKKLHQAAATAAKTSSTTSPSG